MLRPSEGSRDENVVARPLLVVTTAGTGEVVAATRTETLTWDLDSWSLSGTGWTTVGLYGISTSGGTGNGDRGSLVTVTGWCCCRLVESSGNGASMNGSLVSLRCLLFLL